MNFIWTHKGTNSGSKINMIMIRIFLWITFFPLILHAQNLEWAAAITGNMPSSVTGFISADKNTIVWASSEFSGTLYDAEGVQQRTYGGILCFTKKGKMRWSYDLQSDWWVEGICHTPTGEIVAIVRAEGYGDEQDNDYYYEEDYYADYPKEEEGDDYYKDYVLMTFSADGSLLKEVHCADINSEAITIHDMVYNSDGQIIVSGEVDDAVISTRFPENKSPEGGDFILSINEQGQTQWVQTIDFRDYGSRFVVYNRIALAPDGSVFIGGVYMNGATFGKKIKKLAPQTYADKQKNREGYETYLACYDSNGKFKWVRTSGERAIFASLAADDKHVYIGYSTTSPEAFGGPVDTTDKKHVVVSAFSQKGKLKWHYSGIGDNIADITADNNNTILFTGEFSHYSDTPLNYHGVELTKLDHMLVTGIDSKGKFKLAKPAEIPVSINNTPLFILTDGEGCIYAAGLLWCALKIEMNLWEDAFPETDCYGGATFLVKLK